ncbi:MAG: LysM peptidoglycan-binding domain-containing protein [Candidatus Pristimantibacillus sp.]
MKIYVVKKGDTLYFISQKHNVSIQEILELNPGITNPDVLDVGMKIKIPSGGSSTGTGGVEIMHQHVVKQGDTLWKLSKAWGVPLADMIKANPQLKNPNVLLTGEIVNIPKTSHSSAAVPAATGGGMHPLHPMSLMQGVQGWVGKKPTGQIPGKTPTAPITATPAPTPTPAPVTPAPTLPTKTPTAPIAKTPTAPIVTPNKPAPEPAPQPVAVKPTKKPLPIEKAAEKKVHPSNSEFLKPSVDLFKQHGIPATEASSPIMQSPVYSGYGYGGYAAPAISPAQTGYGGWAQPMNHMPNIGPSNIGPSNIGPSNIGPSNLGPANMMGPNAMAPNVMGQNTMICPPGMMPIWEPYGYGHGGVLPANVGPENMGYGYGGVSPANVGPENMGYGYGGVSPANVGPENMGYGYGGLSPANIGPENMGFGYGGVSPANVGPENMGYGYGGVSPANIGPENMGFGYGGVSPANIGPENMGFGYGGISPANVSPENMGYGYAGISPANVGPENAGYGYGYPAWGFPPFPPYPTTWPEQTAGVASDKSCGCKGKREEESPEQTALLETVKSGKATVQRKGTKKAVIRSVAPRTKSAKGRGNSRPWIKR